MTTNTTKASAPEAKAPAVIDSLGDRVKHTLENWLTEAERAVAALDQAAKRGPS